MINEKRFEIKYVCPPEKLSSVLYWLECSSMIFMSQHYPERQVNSLYFDKFDFNDASLNLIGLGDRKKLRLRWYGKKDTCHVVAEYKYKTNNAVNKKTIPIGNINIGAIHIYELIELLQSLNSSVAEDIRIHHPVLRTQYNRHYYGNNDQLIRITIDNDLCYSPVNSLDCLISSENKILLPYSVIEFKYGLNKVQDASKLLSTFPLKPSRHSKYLASFSKLNNIPY